MSFSEPFIRRPVMTAVSTAAVLLFGVLAYRQLPVNDLPAVDYPVIQVQADYPGASPETVAANIATPLERRFMQIKRLELVTSQSTPGHVHLTLQFAPPQSVDALAAASRNGTSYAGAGQLDGAAGTLLLHPQGQLDSALAYNNLIVGSKGGSPIYLRDVAEARDGVQDERVNLHFWVRGYPVPSATVVIAVFRRAGANAVEVANNVRQLLPQVNAELPASVRLNTIYDRSWSIVRSIGDVQQTLLIAFVLVVGVIFLFLGRARDTLIPAVALPPSLLLTFVVVRVLGYSLDNLSLMALTLAVGFLEDHAC